MPNPITANVLPVAVSGRDAMVRAQNTIAGWQKKLLNLTPANRLLRFRVTELSCVPVVAPEPRVLFERLVLSDRPLPVVPAKSQETPEQAQLDFGEEIGGEEGLPGRRPAGNRFIVSSYHPDHLISAMYNLLLKSRASVEERGVNVLYLVLGFLAWDDTQERELRWQAPLILAPATIDRSGPNKYTLAALDEDVVLNPTLVYKLDHDFGLALPELPDDLDALDVDAYLADIEKATRDLTNRAVERTAYLGLFSFLKMPMYQDLTRHAEALLKHSLISRLAGTPPAEREASVWPSFGEDLDRHIDPRQTFQVLDADSSQQEALLTARSGAHLLIEGPPGTGKSQTIANLIAESLADGKRVLFVSEKAAALEVVKRRLDGCGLGDACLDLHSHKVDKKKILAELERVLNSQRPAAPARASTMLESLTQVRDDLNSYVGALHAPRFAAKMSAYRVYGLLADLKAAPAVRYDITEAPKLTEPDIQSRRELLEALTAHAPVIERLDDHPWRGLKPRPPSFAYAGEVRSHLGSLQQQARELAHAVGSAHAETGWRWPEDVAGLEVVLAALRDFRAEALSSSADDWFARFSAGYASWTRYLNPRYWLDLNALRRPRRAGWTLNHGQLTVELERLRRAADLMGSTAAPSPADSQVTPHLEEIGKLLAGIQSELAYFGQQFDADTFRAFGVRRGPSVIEPWCAERLSSLDQLDDYLAYANARAWADGANLAGFLDAARAQGVPIATLPAAYLRALYEAWLDKAGLEAPVLAYFARSDHEKRIERFRALDVNQLKLAGHAIAVKLGAARPTVGGLAEHAPSAEISVLTREFRKQRRIKPLRKLFREAPQVIQRLKPCFMMSPLSVSQFLDPEHFHFHLVIFDEASQVKVEDSVGCIFRAEQVVVAGDRQQLPPTRFFDVMTSDEDWDEERDDDSDAYESILDALAAVPSDVAQKMLLWHYRSRHEALIAFSNKNFYGGKLYTFPDPAQAASSVHGAGGREAGASGSPVEFVHVENGIYERGTSRKNPIEARRVVELIFEHVRQHSDWSLAVVTFSEAQRDAIQRLLDKELERKREVRDFFEDKRSEPFRVKNLELIQGDERDALIFSVGYGRDEQGRPPSLNFGPLNKAGGRRRLNVAVTRARRHVTVVSSITPEELARSDNEGVRLLREYMMLARDGLRVLQSDTRVAAHGEVESPFEAMVYAALTAAGLEVHPQVGCSGYRIDLAVVDPKNPDRYCLGVECDGATYHSARTARDRDRLRQQILEGLGWRIHRIWSRDWSANPEREVKLVLDLVRKYAGTQPEEPGANPAQGAQAENEAQGAPLAFDTRPVSPPPHVANPSGSLPTGAVYYEQFKGAYSNRQSQLYIAQMVEFQGPTHMDVIIRAIAHARSLYVTAQTRTAIRTEIQQAAAKGLVRLSKDKAFVWPAKSMPVIVRVPRPDEELRTMDQICPEELSEAVKLCLRDAGGGASQDDTARMVARLYGYQRATEKIVQPVHLAITSMLRGGELVSIGGMLRLAEKP